MSHGAWKHFSFHPKMPNERSAAENVRAHFGTARCSRRSVEARTQHKEKDKHPKIYATSPEAVD